MRIHVAPDGTGDGSRDTPCSLDAAPAAVRRAVASTTEAIEVVLAGGTYVRDTPLVLTAADGGSASQPITWCAAEGEAPVLSSAKSATGFTLHDEERNVWRTSIDEPAGFSFEHLWSAGGVALQRAWTGFKNPHVKRSRRGIRLAPSFGTRPEDFRNPDDVVMVGRHFWYYVAENAAGATSTDFVWDPLTARALQNPKLTIGVIGWTGYLAQRARRHRTVALENALEFLDTPGEWYLDRHTGELFVCPLDSMGQDLSVRYPTLRCFIRVDGRVDRHVAHLGFRGLHFRFNDGDKIHVTASWPTEPTVLETPEQENALQINAGSNITIRDCSFKNIGNEAIHFDLAGRHNVVIGNAFENVSGTAIAVSQSNLVAPEGHGFTEIHAENRPKIFEDFAINNNYVHRTVTNNLRMAHAISYSEFIHGLQVSHNDIADTAGQAVRNSWRYGGYKGGHAGGIEYSWNRVSGVGNKGFSDYGSLYIACANDGRENNVHHNLVDGIGAPDRQNIGLYFDAHVTNGHFYENVLLNVGPRLGLFGNYWVGFVACRGNSAHHNWVHGNRSAQDMDLTGRVGALEPLGLRRLFVGRRNPIYANTFYDELPDELPDEARAIIDGAGLQAEFRHIKESLEVDP